MVAITELPIDLLLLFLPYLDVKSFVNFTSTCKTLHDPHLVQDAAYWSHRVRRDFRLPNQPVVAHDGHRWQKLYRQLTCNTKIYLWGSDEKYQIGTLAQKSVSSTEQPHDPRRAFSSWPNEASFTKGLGVIADLQCGGSSTCMLNTKGTLYTIGAISDAHEADVANVMPVQLTFANVTVTSPHEHDLNTTIKHFSAGESHVLAVADSGRVWCWWDSQQAGVRLKFLMHDVCERGLEKGAGVVKKVVAGSSLSGALIEGVGIVLWESVSLDPPNGDSVDIMLVLNSQVVPNTNSQRGREASSKASNTTSAHEEADCVGEVLNFILLEGMVIFNTSLGKVFTALVTWNEGVQQAELPIELPLALLRSYATSVDPDAAFATDVQGSYLSFAVFARSGAVLTSNHTTVRAWLTFNGQTRTSSGSLPRLFGLIPALQHQDIVSIAFGEHHFHALHLSGHITSYGEEPQACGALGLGGGGRASPEGRLRGIQYLGVRGNGRLVPHAYTTGRRVWFDKEKPHWIQFLTSGGADPQEAVERMRMAIGSPGVEVQGEVSEWIEQEGNAWEAKLGLHNEAHSGTHPTPYFALSVAAGKRHSGAIVLVDEEQAQRVSNACEVVDLKPTTIDSIPQQSSAYLDLSISSVANYMRALLGFDISSSAQADNGGRPTPRASPRRSFGDSPRPGFLYAWAKDHFPRLVLSSGVVMPGTVKLDEWHEGRPEWNMHWDRSEPGTP